MANEDWASALAEAENPQTRDAGLWARSFAESNGDEGKAKATYVKARMGLDTSPSPAAGPVSTSSQSERGWCPVCHARMDLGSIYCSSCSSNLEARGLSPLRYQPTSPPRTGPAEPVIVKTARSRGVYIILGLFFGLLGIHNFYAGRYGIGVAQLLITGILGWFVVGLFITAIWVIVELFTVKEDGAGDAMS